MSSGPSQTYKPRPQIVRKRQRRLTGVDQMVLSLYAKGLTTGEISAHFAEIYGASVSRETISRILELEAPGAGDMEPGSCRLPAAVSHPRRRGGRSPLS